MKNLQKKKKTKTNSAKFRDSFNIAIKASTPVIQICTYEWERLRGFCVQAAQQFNRSFFVWNRIHGKRKWDAENKEFSEPDDNPDPADVLDKFISEQETDSILLLEDFHPCLTDDLIIQRLRECVRISRESKKTLIFQTISFSTIKDLEKEVPILELPLPPKDVLKTTLEQVIEDLPYDNKPHNDSEITEIIDASLGLSTYEAENTYRQIVAQFNRISANEIDQIIKAKEAIIKKSGILEYFHPDENIESVGGLEILKKWLHFRGRSFSDEAKKFGLAPPKGILLLGIPGCGKSLIAKAIANEWKMPLLKFDLGKVFAGIVGESESNIRKALSLAETISPSILWIDEIEKGLSGLGSNGDSGTSSRVFGTLLTWMQEKNSDVFVVATANNIESLPPELLRKGRFDETFFVDLPNKKERQEIFKIHIEKKRRDLDQFDFEKLSEKSVGFSGAEIESAVNDALFTAFDESRDLKQEDIESSIKATYPLSKTMANSIEHLRKWAKVRAKFASEENTESIDEDTTTPKLPLERKNPFV